MSFPNTGTSTAGDNQYGDAIAIVGMACRFPGDATDIESFWKMMCEEKDAWSEIPSDRFNTNGVAHTFGWSHELNSLIFALLQCYQFHIRSAHFIKNDIAAFDAPFFSISTAEAISMDPQQRMLLEVVYEALDSAGIPVASLSSSATSVFCGSFVRDYEQPCMRDPETTPPYSATGNGIAILANRISHAFDFAGTSQTIDTGCSASLVAVHQACRSLLSGESSVGIAAGVGLIFSPNTIVPMANLNILSPDGRCFAFDSRANGYGRGEGCGVVVLKRLKDAIADNDTIRAVIRATASNQDGHTQGITLPSKERQIQNMGGIYRNHNLDITRTAYVECHGTGTQAGDTKEAEAVSHVFCSNRKPDNPLIIGSVKTNIGHLEGSAGVAGLIKGVLVVERGYIPKHLNFTSANPNIDFEELRIKVATELTPWPVPGLRRASVNSFGFGGTNAHVVLDDAPHFFAESQTYIGHHNTFLFPSDNRSKFKEPLSKLQQNRLFVFSGHDDTGLSRVLDTQAAYLGEHGMEHRFEDDYAYTLFSRRSRLTMRTFAVAASANELLEKLHSRAIPDPFRASTHKLGHLALVFSGQGSQWYAMGRELLNYSIFYDSISTASEYMSTDLKSPFHLLSELLRSKDSSHIDEPHIAQPATTALQVALVDLLLASGLHPSTVIGHSSGEIAAAYAVGAICREDAWKISYCRGQCVTQMQVLAPGSRGGMLAVAISEQDARAGLLEAGTKSVEIACINGPASVTLSGDAGEIFFLHDFFRSRSITSALVRVNTAYHSKQMHVIESLYYKALEGVTAQHETNQGTFVSSVYGRPVSTKELDANYWVQNLILPVQFYKAAVALIKDFAPDIFLEVSPHSVWGLTLSQIYAGNLAGKSNTISPTFLSLLHRGNDASATFLAVMGEFWMRGHILKLDWLFSSNNERPHHLVDVPSYPWDHSRKYWHESHLSKTNRFRSHGREDLLGTPLENSTPQDPSWRGFFRVQENPWLKDHVIQKSILYPAGGMVAMAIEAAKQMANNRRTVSGYGVSDFAILKPMLIPTTTQGLENLMRAHLVKRAEYETIYDFSVISHPDNESWITHATGRFSIFYKDDCSGLRTKKEDEASIESIRDTYHSTLEACHGEYVPRQFYESLDVIGMSYGSQFRNITGIKKGKSVACSVIQIADTKSCMPFQFEFDHVIHPTTLDAMIQTVLPLASEDDDPMLPCSAARIFVSAGLPKGAASRFRGYTAAHRIALNSVSADIVMLDDKLEDVAVVIENLVLKSLSKEENAKAGSFLPSHRNLCSQIVWGQDVSSIAALGHRVPETPGEFIGLIAHKNPALSILYHCGLGTDRITHEFSGDKSLGILFDSLNFDNLIFNTLVAGYVTPRFLSCVISGSEEVQQIVRTRHISHHAFQRIRTAARLPAESNFDLVLCSVDDFTAQSEIIACVNRVASRGWLIFVSRTEKNFDAALLKALSKAIFASGFRVDVSASTASNFIAARRHPVTASAPTSIKFKDIILLLPDNMSTSTLSLKNDVSFNLRAKLSCRVCEVTFSSIASLPLEELHSKAVISFAEIDSPIIYSMGANEFSALHRLLASSKNLLWITSGAELQARDPQRMPFVGLARTLRSEDDSRRIISLDLDIQAHTRQPAISSSCAESIVWLFEEVLARGEWNGPITEDTEFVYSGDQLLIPRLMPLSLLNHLIEKGQSEPQMVARVPLEAKDRALKLDVSSIRSPSGPLFVDDSETAQRALQPYEVRIAIAGTNLLPEDIVLASSGGVFFSEMGTDIFGYVIDVGSQVQNLAPQCRVVARARGTIRTHAIVDQCRVRQIRTEDAWRNGCPTAFATAVYAFKTSRPIARGDFVLVFGAATAYGQAAIRLAHALGTHVLVACMTPTEQLAVERTSIVSPSNILDGAGDRLELSVLALTNNRGADVVFDPTSAHLELAFRCVAECGRVVRIGYSGCESPDRQLFTKAVSFETVDIGLLERRRPTEAKRLASDMDELLQLLPTLGIAHDVLEYRMCDLQMILKAAAKVPFQGHIVLLTQSPGLGHNHDLVNMSVQLTQKVALCAHSTYLLIGGLGGLGRSIAEHLANNGAKHIAFFSRSGARSALSQEFTAKLAAKGVDARAFGVDICDQQELVAALETLRHNMPPIRGAVQCAAVVDDAIFQDMDYERWQRCFGPKALGSYNLHLLLAKDMDFFVLLSSSSGVIGNRCQGPYAAGNSFQDALARHRSALGMHTVSLDLGLVLGAGMVADNEALLDTMKSAGFLGMRLRDFLFVLDRAMAKPGLEGIDLPAQVVTTVGTGGLTIQNQPSDPFWTRTAMFRYLNQVDAPPTGLHGGQTGSGIGGESRRALGTAIRAAASVDDARGVVCAALIAAVARRKSMVPEDFDKDRTLRSYGIDSLDSIFLLSWIARETGATMQTVEGMTIGELSGAVVQRVMEA